MVLPWINKSHKSRILLRFISGGPSYVDLRNTMDSFSIEWYNPREGDCSYEKGSKERLTPGTIVDLGSPPAEPEILVKKI